MKNFLTLLFLFIAFTGFAQPVIRSSWTTNPPSTTSIDSGGNIAIGAGNVISLGANAWLNLGSGDIVYPGTFNNALTPTGGNYPNGNTLFNSSGLFLLDGTKVNKNATVATNLAFLPEVWVFSNGTPVNNVTTFTNPQVAINTLLATNNSTILINRGDGTSIVYPPVGGTVHLANGEWFGTIDLTSSNSSQLHITGNGINSRLVASSRVININDPSGIGLNYMLEIDHVAILATNQATNDVMIYIPNQQQLNFHDNFVTRYSDFFQTNIVSYLAWNVAQFTNATGLVGMYDAAGLNNQWIYHNVFAGLSHGVVGVGDHIQINDNNFTGISEFVLGGVTIVNSNLWTWTSPMFGNGNITAAELTEGACVALSDKGGLTIHDNHYFETPYSVYRNKLASSLYGKPDITRNLGESTVCDIFTDASNRVPANISFYNNFSGAGTILGSVVGWADFSKLANVTNIVLTGWTPAFINGTYKLNSNASTFGGNFLSYMTWTNVLNTNKFITLNDPTTVGGFEIQDSTNYIGSSTPDFSADTTQTYPILNPVYTTTWTPFFGGTSGVFTWGTNQARASNVQNLASNLNVYDGGNFTDSNGVFTASQFNGSGSGLTGVTANSPVTFYTNSFATGSNIWNRPILICGDVIYTEAAVAGVSALELEISTKTNRAMMPTFVGGFAGGTTNPIAPMTIPVNGTWKTKDISSGIGNAASAGSAQITIY